VKFFALLRKSNSRNWVLIVILSLKDVSLLDLKMGNVV